MGNRPIRGYQLRADGHGVTCRPGDVMRFLREVVPAIDMTIIDGPYISEPHGQGIVIIAESHIFFQARGSDATCIVFSCRRFSWAIVHAMLRDIFGGQWVTRYDVERSIPPGWSWRHFLRALVSWCIGPPRAGPRR